MQRRVTLQVLHLAYGRLTYNIRTIYMLMFHRHPHIYGIDLASPSALIAHKRDDDEIARHIGAEKVIFQELNDLIEACANAVVPYAVARPNQQFEVGVFNGKYVTPVPRGYFSHLEQIRGETKKIKVMEQAREAVANGLAGEDEIKIATNGVMVDDKGKIVPAQANGHAQRASTGSQAERETHDRRGWEEKVPEHRMDIGLHNQADFD